MAAVPSSAVQCSLLAGCSYSNSADLAGFRNQLLFVSGPGNVPNTVRKRPSEETRTTQSTGPRQAY